MAEMHNSLLHLDIDAFFAYIEQLRNPHLKGRPVIVGNGVIASCSYEARRFGLSAGMPLRHRNGHKSERNQGTDQF